jgi:hypothetical protein
VSTLRVNTIQDASGGDIVNSRGIAKAWVNFNGSGTVAIRAAHNVSSITDNGVGNYTLNFTAALADANYAISCGGWAGNPCTGNSQSASACSVISFYNGTYIDVLQLTVVVHR